MPTFANYDGLGVDPPRAMALRHESIETRVARLERNLANVANALDRMGQYLEDRHVVENSAAGASAWARVTNLWNILLREGVTRTPY